LFDAFVFGLTKRIAVCKPYKLSSKCHNLARFMCFYEANDR